MELTPRKQKILSYVVRCYIRYGEPVGSKLIADEIGVSSATVRNEMAELTEQGLLEQPHTSAGRIPSGRGYRVFINNLGPELSIDPKEKAAFDSQLSGAPPDTEHLLLQAAEFLAEENTCAVTAPGGEQAKIKAVQFVQISRRTGMLILMSSAGTVKNRIFRCDFDLSPEIMRIFFRVFNERLTGLAVGEITPAFLQSLAVSFGDMSILMTSALMSLFEASQETSRPDIVVKGQMNLFAHRDLDSPTVRRLTELLQSPLQMRNFLLKRSGKLSILLGQETGYPELKSAGIVAVPYGVDGNDAGMFAIIGPMRMDYPKIISRLRYVSHCVGNALTEFMREEL